MYVQRRFIPAHRLPLSSRCTLYTSSHHYKWPVGFAIQRDTRIRRLFLSRTNRVEERDEELGFIIIFIPHRLLLRMTDSENKVCLCLPRIVSIFILASIIFPTFCWPSSREFLSCKLLFFYHRLRKNCCRHFLSLFSNGNSLSKTKLATE